MEKIKSFAKNIFLNDNKINESNIIMCVGVVLLFIDNFLVMINMFLRDLSLIEVAFIGIYMVFIFLMCKFENTSFKNNDAIKLANSITEGLKNK